MRFYSTNHQSPAVDFETALFSGLAPDGGLYYPETIPQFTKSELKSLPHLSLPEIGVLVLQKWLGTEISTADLKTLVYQALDFPIPIKPVGPYHIMELFHGPTLAFKDVAAKCLAQLLSFYLQKRQQQSIILVATSGDTGGAVAQGFANVENVKVIVLYPKGKVSRLQEQQLTRVADNILPFEVAGVFDDCQLLVKTALNDDQLKHLPLTSANSINIGRLLPQIIYYVYAYSRLPKKPLQFVIPSGNMGNSTAGIFAMGMGLPIQSFLLACNANDPAVEYYHTGKYQPKQTIATLSNAMDIGNPSNFARILEYFHYNHQEFCKKITAISIDDPTTIATIKNVYAKYHYLLDPHTAVAWSAADIHNKLRRSDANKREADPTPEGGRDLSPAFARSEQSKQLIISTASPVKFASEILKATGISIDDKAALAKLTQPPRKTNLENNHDKFKAIIEDFANK